MHRSGTSLAASAFGRAGLALGKRLNGPGFGNPRGHFEDADVWRLHEEMLAAAGLTAFSAGDDFVPPLGNALGNGFVARARSLVAARAGQRAWGWKDPRTCLFLDLWQPLVPRAGWLVLYRHPVDVVLSLLRRSTEPEFWMEPRLAFASWVVHNRRLLAFVKRHRERCFVAQVPALATDLEGLVARVAERFALPLEPAHAAAPLAAEELAPTLPERHRPAWERVVPDALELYRRLDAIADLPGAAEETRDDDATDERLPPTSSAGRERARPELRLSEALLFELLEASVLRRQQRAAAEGFAVALEEERAARAVEQQELRREQQRTDELRHRLVEMEDRVCDAAARRDELAATLAAVERSRSFRLIDGWWRLAGRLRGARGPA